MKHCAQCLHEFMSWHGLLSSLSIFRNRPIQFNARGMQFSIITVMSRLGYIPALRWGSLYGALRK